MDEVLPEFNGENEMDFYVGKCVPHENNACMFSIEYTRYILHDNLVIM